jgi:hypothetical protein
MRKGDIRGGGRINKSAFRPRLNGQDRDGLSVSISDPEYLELHRAKYEQPGKATVSIVVGDVREIGRRIGREIVLDVVAAPDDDPRHALITGIPDLTLGEAQKLDAERIAELLAKAAKVYEFPALDNSGSSTTSIT